MESSPKRTEVKLQKRSDKGILKATGKIAVDISVGVFEMLMPLILEILGSLLVVALIVAMVKKLRGERRLD